MTIRQSKADKTVLMIILAAQMFGLKLSKMSQDRYVKRLRQLMRKKEDQTFYDEAKLQLQELASPPNVWFKAQQNELSQGRLGQ